MDKSIAGVKMDRHLLTIQKETKSALIQFKESGLTVDDDFIKYFLKLSIESMTRTCERFQTEWNMLNRSVQSPKNVSTSNGASSSGVKGSKRKSVGNASESTEQSKKQKMMPFNSNATDDDDVVFFCDFCTDPNDGSKSFSGTANEVRKHWMSFHSNEPISQLPQNNTNEEEPQQMNTIFFCDHCIDPNDSSKLFSGTVDQVYDHWLSSHLNESISLPFQFHAVDLARCLHCEEVGAYHDLVEHHKNQHLGKLFTISDRMNSNKCGICQFQDGNLIEHFKSNHESVTPPKIFNPVFYSENRITELLDIVAEKEHRCIECNQTFGTHAETYKHFAISHVGQIIELNPFVGGRRQPAYLICGFCTEIVDVDQYLNHFKTHTYNFKCSKCAYRSSDLAQLVFHERQVHSKDSLGYHCSVFPNWLRNKFHNTKLVFGNGLVLKNYNVVGTKFDDSKSFNIFIDGILDAKKECLEQMMKINPANFEKKSQQVAKNDSTLIAELNKQRCLTNNLYISGIVGSLKLIGPQNIFLKICENLEVHVTESDIKQIGEKGFTGISVELHRFELKKMIIKHGASQTVWSNELAHLSKGQKPWKIPLQNELTPYYFEIMRVALDLSKKKKLHSFNICHDGLMVKRTPTDAGQAVRSKQELFDYINKKEKPT